MEGKGVCQWLLLYVHVHVYMYMCCEFHSSGLSFITECIEEVILLM